MTLSLRTVAAPIAMMSLSLVMVGCVFRPPLEGMSDDRAFIRTYPATVSPGKLRLAVKDNIDLKGEVTTAGSELFAKNNAPAKEDAACMQIVRERDVAIVGKTNMAEFAMGTTGMNRYFGMPKNPLKSFHITRLLPGGSSSGSAVAVASGAADVAFGSDTAGSIRVPAACCGIYGLKTTKGLVSLEGVYPVSEKNLDTVGPMAANVANLVKGMGLLERGFEGQYEKAVEANPTGRQIRVGRLHVPRTQVGVDDAVDGALKAAGFEVVMLDEAFSKAWEQAHSDGNTIATVDGWLTNEKHKDSPQVSNLVKSALLIGDIDYPKAYEEALARRDEWRRTLSAVLRKVDLIALPTLRRRPIPLPILGRTALLEGVMLLAQNTVPVNYAGNPAVAVPIPHENGGLPASLQLVGPRYGEEKLLNAARIVESNVEWTDRKKQ